jgi:hypothetical protein
VLFALLSGVLLPSLLASAAFVAVTWLWAAATCFSLASSLPLSHTGLALWLLMQAYSLVFAGDLLRSECTLAAARVYACNRGPVMH